MSHFSSYSFFAPGGDGWAASSSSASSLLSTSVLAPRPNNDLSSKEGTPKSFGAGVPSLEDKSFGADVKAFLEQEVPIAIDAATSFLDTKDKVQTKMYLSHSERQILDEKMATGVERCLFSIMQKNYMEDKFGKKDKRSIWFLGWVKCWSDSTVGSSDSDTCEGIAMSHAYGIVDAKVGTETGR